jgi:hypothetical protein
MRWFTRLESNACVTWYHDFSDAIDANGGQYLRQISRHASFGYQAALLYHIPSTPERLGQPLETLTWAGRLLIVCGKEIIGFAKI